MYLEALFDFDMEQFLKVGGDKFLLAALKQNSPRLVRTEAIKLAQALQEDSKKPQIHIKQSDTQLNFFINTMKNLNISELKESVQPQLLYPEELELELEEVHGHPDCY